MNAIALLVALLAGIAPAVAGESFFRHVTSYNRTNYQSIITSATLSKAPIWKQTEGFPPFSPRQAGVVAAEYASALFSDWTPANDMDALIGSLPIVPPRNEWTPQTILLKQVEPERWIYIVKVTPPLPREFVTGLIGSIDVVVLMDGMVVPLVATALSK